MSVRTKLVSLVKMPDDISEESISTFYKNPYRIGVDVNVVNDIQGTSINLIPVKVDNEFYIINLGGNMTLKDFFRKICGSKK